MAYFKMGNNRILLKCGLARTAFLFDPREIRPCRNVVKFTGLRNGNLHGLHEVPQFHERPGHHQLVEPSLNEWLHSKHRLEVCPGRRLAQYTSGANSTGAPAFTSLLSRA